MADPTLVIKILAENKHAQKALNETATAAQKVEAGFGAAALPAAAALGAIALGASKAADAASRAEQAAGAVTSVFKDQARVVHDLATRSATDVGLASSEYEKMAAVFGSQLKSMGASADQLVPRTDALIGLGADLAATFGGETSDAVAAVSSLLRGERDPIERYGVAIKDADVQARLAAQGLDKLTGEAKKQATAQATLELLFMATRDAQGAFARESNTAANAQQVANAQFEDASAALGVALLPVIVTVTGALGSLAVIVRDNATAFQIIVGVVAAVAAGILAVNVAFKVYRAATLAVTAAQWLLNAAMAANPIGLVVIAVAALAAGLVLLWQNSETFRRIVTSVFNAVLAVVKSVVAWIQGAFAKLGAILAAPWKVFQDAVTRAVAVVRSIVGALAGFIEGVFAGIRAAAKTVGDAVDAVNPFTAPPPAARTAGRLVAGPWSRAAARSTGGGSPITVNVYTTGDTIEAEQAVVRALRRTQRLNAGRVLPSFGLGSAT